MRMSDDIASRPQMRISVTKRRQNGGSTSGAIARSVDDDGEADPVAAMRRCARHFGVGTNRPVGRKSSVRISATNETITAWAGLTTSEA